MKLITNGTNRSTLQLKDGTLVFFSYETPVAGKHPQLGWFKSDEPHSVTTRKHIGQFFNEYKPDDAEVTDVAYGLIDKFLMAPTGGF